MRFYCLCCLLFVFGCEQSKPTTPAPVVEQGEAAPIPDEQQAGDQHAEAHKGEPLAGMGIMVGELTPDSALVQVRLTETDKLVDRDVKGAAGVVRFTLLPVAAKGGAEIKDNPQTVEAVADHDFIARAAFTGLTPGTKYECKTEIGKTAEHLHAGPVAHFETLPGPTLAEPVKFVVVTGMNYAKFHGDDRIDKKQHLIENNTNLPQPYSGPDKHLGYPALETILKLKPLFFVGTGDNVYYDTPDNPRAKTIPEMRQKWHEQFIQPRYRDLFAEVPTYWEIDDHDYRIDDGDNTGDHHPTPQEGRDMMLEQLPVAPMGDKDAKTYRTHRVSKDLQIWLPENRMYRSPNAMEDGPEKSIWGKEQRAWLQKTLKESDATYKLLISPTPMIGPDDLRKTDNHCDIGGFRHERDDFFKWLKENGLDQQNFFIVCGDRHWQYHSVDPSGFEEFSSGALVDANSRLGRKPGDPKSTDAKGEIKQPYYQDPRSGGFLEVKVTPADKEQPATLSFLFHDEKGKLLYQHDVPPKK
ncbi:MAG: alkaline phosphatase D family protein [Gimesia chilikensis]|uniref:alkaline phosphatase D family protein n=1 Tax=Gimesia chilikensis TaxID=2605989 RepID=UPI0037A5A837